MKIDKQFLFIVKDYMRPFPSLKRPRKKRMGVHNTRVEELSELDIILVDVGIWANL